MSHHIAILENFAAELAPLAEFQMTIDVGTGRGDMRPWEFDELQEIFRELHPDAPPLKQRQAKQRR